MSNPRLPLAPELTEKTKQWAQDRIIPATKRVVDVDYVFDVIAGAEERVVHRLGRTPTGFRVVAQSAPGSVYASTTGRAHDRKYLYLKSSTAGLTVQLEVF